MPTPSLTLFIEDYKRASLAGALPEPDTLLRQLDELCEEAHPGECSKPSYITDYQRARLAGLPVDPGLQVVQLELAFEAESAPDEGEEDICDECGMHCCDGECVDYDEDEDEEEDDEDEDDEDCCPDCGSEFCYGWCAADECPDCGSEFCYGGCDYEDNEDEDHSA